MYLSLLPCFNVSSKILFQNDPEPGFVPTDLTYDTHLCNAGRIRQTYGAIPWVEEQLVLAKRNSGIVDEESYGGDVDAGESYDNGGTNDGNNDGNNKTHWRNEQKLLFGTIDAAWTRDVMFNHILGMNNKKKKKDGSNKKEGFIKGGVPRPGEVDEDASSFTIPVRNFRGIVKEIQDEMPQNVEGKNGQQKW